MKLTMFARVERYGRRAGWGVALAGVMLAVGATLIGDVSPEAKRARGGRSFELFAGPTAVLDGNQYQCGLNNTGEVCVNVFGSPTGGGGAWPIGTPDGYIFNTGMQVAGIMSPDAGPWANDTVGAYFFDARGTQRAGTGLTNIFLSTDANDLANWPAEAFVSDPTLFNPVLLGRKAASQQDSWVKYWDGNPGKLGTSTAHPMGMRITQRSLAWNFPSGNESILYFLYNFENATGDPEFQRLNELQFFGGQDALPDGIRIDSIFAAFSTDMDVADFDENFSTAVLPFNLGLSYDGTFQAIGFVFPPAIFHPPFLTGVGLSGVKYLRSPNDPATGQALGLTLFSGTVNSSTGFPDPVGDDQLWRYLSGNVDPGRGDFPCNVTAETPTSRSLCFLSQTNADTRFFESSGPFSLDPGDAQTIVVAYVVAPTVETLPDGSGTGLVLPTTDPNANAPGTPSFHPGFASTRGCDVAGMNCTQQLSAAANAVRPLERAAGWVSFSGAPPAGDLESPDNRIDQLEVVTVPGSLLGRALVAQTIFDNNFLLGFAPDPPAFNLVPGDGKVTILWQRSPSETGGDPFFQVASDSTSALFNPNYRQFDVEGYRVWRGSSPTNLGLVAQFDFASTTFSDFTCETVGPTDDVGAQAINQVGDTVAVVGFAAGEICPLGASPLVKTIDSNLTFNNGGDGGSPGGGVVRTNGLAAVAVSTQSPGDPNDPAGPALPLNDSDVPFVFVDDGLPNNFTFFYAVSAFDVNSQASGPLSLRSGRPTQSTVPRKAAPNLELAEVKFFLSGDDGQALNPTAFPPTIDSNDGIFSGPQPPADGAQLSFAPNVARLLGQFSRSIRIDSIAPDVIDQTQCVTLGAFGLAGYNFFDQCYAMFLTAEADGVETPVVVKGEMLAWDFPGNGLQAVFTQELASSSVPFDPKALAAFGIASGSAKAIATGVFETGVSNSAAEGYGTRRSFSSARSREAVSHGGSRWFDGTVNNTPDPAKFIRVGHLNGIDTVWSPLANTQLGPGQAIYPASGDMECFPVLFGILGRAADVQVTWGGGTFASVRDITHNVDVPLSADIRASYGFLNTDANGNGVLDWDDFNWITSASIANNTPVGCVSNPPTGQVTLEASPTIMPTSTEGDDPGAIAATGMGFGLYINGQAFIFETSALPADGTLWTLRTYTGRVAAFSGNRDTDDPDNYSFRPTFVTSSPGTKGIRPPMVPGLTFNFFAEAGSELVGKPDLTKIHTVPDPYLGTSTLDLSPTEKQLMFVNLPAVANIRIYTLTGVLVNVVKHSDPTGGGREVWNLRNRNNQFVASGVYFFHVQTPDGEEHVGKFTVINFGGQN